METALAKLIRNNAANKATKGKIVFLVIILCCNFVITLVYKYFYSEDGVRPHDICHPLKQLGKSKIDI